ncbi:MAG: polysaccharide biosynthesis/export family protein [Pseudomonadota bacterium]
MRLICHILLAVCFALTACATVATDPAEIPAPLGEYTLGAGDVMDISVWKDEALTRQVVVSPDGLISIPLVGQVKASGLTLAQLREDLTKRLVEYVPDVVVNVAILKADSLKVYVLGQVNKPGDFILQESSTIMQALAIAGGLTPFASARRILIIRQEGDHQTKFSFDYKEVAKGRNLESNILLKRGDVVVVP